KTSAAALRWDNSPANCGAFSSSADVRDLHFRRELLDKLRGHRKGWCTFASLCANFLNIGHSFVNACLRLSPPNVATIAVNSMSKFWVRRS
ncbi:unnamed protein product, partial [Mycena citricolor]